MRLNLGCGNNNPEGYIGLDKRDYGQEIVRDFLRGIPFGNEVFDEVLCSHVLEHVLKGDDTHFVFSEVWRVLKPGGLFVIHVPHADSGEADFPDHVSYWSEKAFEAGVEDNYNHLWRFSIKEMYRTGIQLTCIYRKLPESL